ncbi:hypothetical protein FHW88_004901 [Mucilaginibacter sp. SG538B]|uniref:hypothetical protein n=1 Tax=Mucilaginibacter sp. SG538B TaxID=2587021 RepID=UPI001828C160|nr:hypothetical protein [Mucilaginibacter sp. SG538B]NVM66583.1 hypothetical protein [Mucilaginibacter sp. SG538B]
MLPVIVPFTIPLIWVTLKNYSLFRLFTGLVNAALIAFELTVVESLDKAIAFFSEIGLKLEGRMVVEGEWAGRITGLPDQRVEIGAVTGIVHAVTHPVQTAKALMYRMDPETMVNTSRAIDNTATKLKTGTNVEKAGIYGMITGEIVQLAGGEITQAGDIDLFINFIK